MVLIASLIAAAMIHLPWSQSASVEDLSFLAGTWRGQLGPMTVEETWMEPLSGNMTGMFRMADEGGARILEIMTIIDTDVGPVYRLRHFNDELAPWAAEVDSPLIAKAELIGESSVSFKMVDPEGDLSAITYEIQDGKLIAKAVFRAEDRETFVLVFERVK